MRLLDLLDNLKKMYYDEESTIYENKRIGLLINESTSLSTILEEAICKIRTLLDAELRTGVKFFDSLVIDKAKPLTYRLTVKMNYYGQEYTINLHKFLPCSPDETFPHPHAYPIYTKILKGSYDCHFTYKDLASTESAVTLICGPKELSEYSMDKPDEWHKVVPKEETYTIMIRGKNFTNPSPECKTVSGKDLQEIEPNEKNTLMKEFLGLLR